MEILKIILEEEIEKAYQDIILNETDYYGDADDPYSYGSYDYSYGSGGNSSGGGNEKYGKGLGRILDPQSFTGMLLSPVTGIINAGKLAAAQAGTQIAGLVALLISGTISSLLPFNDPRVVQFLDRKFKYWEQENLKRINQQFSSEIAEFTRGWETFKTDYYGIGFIVSPLIASEIIVGKAADVGLSAINVVSGGGVDRIISIFSGQIRDPGSLERFYRQIDSSRSKEEIEKELEHEQFKELLRRISSNASQRQVRENINTDEKFTGGSFGDSLFGNKKEIKFFPSDLKGTIQKIKEMVSKKTITKQEADQFFKALAKNAVNDSEVQQASNSWSATKISKMFGDMFTDANRSISTGKTGGTVLPQEIAAYKSKIPEMIQKSFDAIKSSNKNFPVNPTKQVVDAALNAAIKATKSMPNQVLSMPTKNVSQQQQPQQQQIPRAR